MARVTVLTVSRYDFVDEESGKRLTGCKVEGFIDGLRDDTEDRKGVQMYRLSLPVEAFVAFDIVPAPYDLDVLSIPVGKRTRHVLQSAKLAPPAKA